MTVPKIRFPGFTDDWEQRKLGELVTENENPIETPTTGYTRLGIRSHHKGTFHEYIEPGKQLETAKMFVASSHHLMFNITFAWEEAWAVTKDSDAGKLVSHRFPQFSFNNGQYDRFYQYRLMNRHFKNALEVASPGGAGRNRVLNKKELLKIQLKVPSEKSEQVAIGQFFDTLENTITLHQRKLESIKLLKKSLLQKMFPKNGESVPEVRFPGFTDAWEQRKLGELGTTYTGISGKTSSDFGHGDARFITYMNVYSNAIANPLMVEPIEIDQKQNEVKVGDVFFTTSSETPDEVGMSSVLLEKQGTVYLNSFCFGYRPKEKIDLHYLAFMLRSEVVRKKIIFLAQGISRYNISKNKMMEISVPLPTIEEQSKIGGFLNNLDNLITLHQRKVESLQKLKKSLLQQMFV